MTHKATIVITVESGSGTANVSTTFDPAVTNDESNDAAYLALKMIQAVKGVSDEDDE